MEPPSLSLPYRPPSPLPLPSPNVIKQTSPFFTSRCNIQGLHALEMRSLMDSRLKRSLGEDEDEQPCTLGLIQIADLSSHVWGKVLCERPRIVYFVVESSSVISPRKKRASKSPGDTKTPSAKKFVVKASFLREYCNVNGLMLRQTLWKRSWFSPPWGTDTRTCYRGIITQKLPALNQRGLAPIKMHTDIRYISVK